MDFRICYCLCINVSIDTRMSTTTRLQIFLIFCKVFLILLCLEAVYAKLQDHLLHMHSFENSNERAVSHSCNHDQIIEKRKQPGRQVYYVAPQVYDFLDTPKPLHRRGRALLEIHDTSTKHKDVKKTIRIYLNYDIVGHSSDRDCQNNGDCKAWGAARALFFDNIMVQERLGFEPVKGKFTVEWIFFLWTRWWCTTS